MSSSLEELKESLSSFSLRGEDPASWEAELKFAGGLYHAKVCSEAAEDYSFKELSFGDLFYSNYHEECIDGAATQVGDFEFTARDIIVGREIVLNAFSWDQFKEVQTIEEAQFYSWQLEALYSWFKTHTREQLSSVMLNWLHLNKGWPSSSDAIIKHYNENVKQIVQGHKWQLLRDAISKFAHRELEFRKKVLGAGGFEEFDFIAYYQAQVQKPQRTVLMSSFRGGGFNPFLTLGELAADLEVQRLNPHSEMLVAVPALLSDYGRNSFLPNYYPRRELEIDWTPTGSQLMTALALKEQGFTLEEALKSAKALN